ncbi:hypothetical protein ACHAWF_017622 [Thalassiosira exigua]
MMWLRSKASTRCEPGTTPSAAPTSAVLPRLRSSRSLPGPRALPRSPSSRSPPRPRALPRSRSSRSLPSPSAASHRHRGRAETRGFGGRSVGGSPTSPRARSEGLVGILREGSYASPRHRIIEITTAYDPLFVPTDEEDSLESIGVFMGFEDVDEEAIDAATVATKGSMATKGTNVSRKSVRWNPRVQGYGRGCNGGLQGLLEGLSDLSIKFQNKLGMDKCAGGGGGKLGCEACEEVQPGEKNCQKCACFDGGNTEDNDLADLEERDDSDTKAAGQDIVEARDAASETQDASNEYRATIQVPDRDASVESKREINPPQEGRDSVEETRNLMEERRTDAVESRSSMSVSSSREERSFQQAQWTYGLVTKYQGSAGKDVAKSPPLMFPQKEVTRSTSSKRQENDVDMGDELSLTDSQSKGDLIGSASPRHQRRGVGVQDRLDTSVDMRSTSSRQSQRGGRRESLKGDRRHSSSLHASAHNIETGVGEGVPAGEDPFSPSMHGFQKSPPMAAEPPEALLSRFLKKKKGNPKKVGTRQAYESSEMPSVPNDTMSRSVNVATMNTQATTGQKERPKKKAFASRTAIRKLKKPVRFMTLGVKSHMKRQPKKMLPIK